MKSELEKLIISDRTAFDMENVPEGHAGRFAAILEEAARRKTTRRRRLYRQGIFRVVGLAASVVFILMLINPLTKMPVEEMDCQVIEAAEYFAYELRSKAEEVRALADLIDPAHRGEVIADIEKLTEISLEHIPSGGVISEEEQIGILFEHYQAKSSSLDMIENSLQTLSINTQPQ